MTPEIKSNPYKFICDYYDSLYPYMGKEVFSVLSLVPCSLILPKIKRNNKEIKIHISCLLLAPSGCMPKDSKVLMSDGEWKNIQDIKVGDEVISPLEDNSIIFSKVLNTTKWKSQKNYRILNKNDLLYKCSFNHEIPHYNTDHKKIGTKEKHNAEWFSKIKTIGNKRLFSSPPICFFKNRKNCEIEPYCLGVWLGDGHFSSRYVRSRCYKGNKFEEVKGFSWINKNNKKVVNKGYIRKSSYRKDNNGWYFNRKLGITSQDYEIINEIIKFYPILSISNYSKTLAKSFNFSTKGEFARLLKKYGLEGKKSGTKFIPKEALLSDIEYRKRLLAGIIDSDGYYDKKGLYYITTKSILLAENIRDLSFSLGCRAKIKKETFSIKSINFKGKYYRISIYIRDADIPLIVNRKKKPGNRNYWQHNSNTFTIRLEEYGEEEVFGFELDSPSHNFITNNWMVTGNSAKSSMCRLFEEITYNPLSTKNMSPPRIMFEFLKRNKSEISLIIEDIAVWFLDEERIKMLEGIAGEEGSLSRENMRNIKETDEDKKVNAVSFLCGTPEAVSNNRIRTGILRRVHPIVVYHSEEENNKIITFIVDNMGKNDIKSKEKNDIIVSFYQELYSIQSGTHAEIEPVEGYFFPDSIKEKIKSLMIIISKPLLKRYGIISATETEQIFRFLSCHAFLNIFEKKKEGKFKNGILTIDDKDFEVAKSLIIREMSTKSVILSCIEAIDYYNINTREKLREWEARRRTKGKDISKEAKFILNGLVR